MCEITFICYATPDYKKRQEKAVKIAEQYFDRVIPYDPSIIDHAFFEENKEVLLHPRGAGACLWKPYIILNAIERFGGTIFYLDVGDLILNNIRIFVETEFREKGIFLVRTPHNHGIYTRRNCFRRMDCDKPEYWSSNQLDAGICAFSEVHTYLLREWMAWNRIPDVAIDPQKNIPSEGNLDGYVAHRCDQSILTNLQIKYDLPTVSAHACLRYVRFNGNTE